ncbi:U-box domain-containing protein 11 [Carica papaya]|uniref:U-box domain-containing protein 11 n=1 Tax=Carica papaya TaxID=3649 RepID=UPI000B8CF30E|nr:U-box domain-containing protein 11 [Carica papaya]
MEVKRRTARSLVAKLSSVSEQTRADALAELRLISKVDAESRPLIAEAGAIPYLAETLYSASYASQENAAATLLNLSISTRDALISTHGLLDALSHALSHHSSPPKTSADAVQSCAATLHSLLIAGDAYRPIIGAKRDIVFSLVDIVKNPTSPTRSVKDALKAMFGIALYPPNRSTMVSLGAVSALVSLMVKDSRTGIVEDASAVVGQIAGCEESEEALRKVSGVRVLVDLLDPGTGSSMRIKENAVAALLNVARSGSERALREVKEMVAAAEEEVTEEIMEVAESGSSKGKMKALELLQLVINEDRHSRLDFLLNQNSND